MATYSRGIPSKSYVYTRMTCGNPRTRTWNLTPHAQPSQATGLRSLRDTLAAGMRCPTGPHPLTGKGRMVRSRLCPTGTPFRQPHHHSATPPIVSGHSQPQLCGGTSPYTHALTMLTPSPQKNATPKLAYLTLAQDITPPT